MTSFAVRDRDFVIIGSQPWNLEIGFNGRSIAKVLAKNNRVLFVNPPVDRATLLREKIQGRSPRNNENKLVRWNENIWILNTSCVLESVNWISSPKIHDFFNKVNNKRFLKDVSAALQQLDFKDYIFFNDNHFVRGFYAPEYLKPALSIYYSRDFLLGVDYWKKHGQRLEPQLIEKYDIGVANSHFLTKFLNQYNKNSFYIGQGCNLEHFNEDKVAGLPSDLGAIPGPIIGYAGALSSIRLDINLLMSIARAKPEWNIVLVGPADEVFASSQLHKMKNVHFLGPKHIDNIPSYIKGFDVCLNPQLINHITVGNYPLKVDEYLAMGKPIVATKTEAMAETFAKHVYLAETTEDYIQMITCALTDNSPPVVKARKAFAATHTWENCVNEIYRAIEETCASDYIKGDAFSAAKCTNRLPEATGKNRFFPIKKVLFLSIIKKLYPY